MKFFGKIFPLLVLILFTILTGYCQNEKKNLKYIFLFIGDGMGMNQVSLTEAAISDSMAFSHLLFTDFPVFGQCETTCKNLFITDSGAAGSAIACGEKENYSNISYFGDAADKEISIAKYLHKKAYKVGIISTCPMDDATPAAFYASNFSRKNYYEIAYDATKSDFELFAGGGFRYFTGKNNDKENIYDVFKQKNYDSISDLTLLKNSNNKKMIFVNPELLNDNEMPYAIDKNFYNRYSLKDITESAINFLDNENGFFIMVEGGKIDWACHENDAATAVKEVLDFNDAVSVAMKFYKEHKDETLIIVTADHETGGLSLGNAKNGYGSSFYNIDKQKISRELLSKKINEYHKNNNNFDFDTVINFIQREFLDTVLLFNEEETVALQKAYDVYLKRDTTISKEKLKATYAGYNPLSLAILKIFTDRLGVGFTTWDHTAAKVPIWALGVGDKLFSGSYENSDIKKKILKALGE